MPRTDRPYSRVYHDTPTDERMLAGAWDDDHALAWWLRLLVEADKAFPAAPYMPAGVNRRGLKVLVEAGLVELVEGRRYRMHGLAAERAKRTALAQAANRARWHEDDPGGSPGGYPGGSPRRSPGGSPKGNPGGYPNGIPRNERRETREERELANARSQTGAHAASLPIDPFLDGLPHLTPAVLEAIETAAAGLFTTASDRVQTELDRLVERHGPEKTIAALKRTANGGHPTFPQLVYGARNRLEPISSGGRPDPKAESADEVRAHIGKRIAAARGGSDS